MYILSVKVDKESAYSRRNFFEKQNSFGNEDHTSDKERTKAS